MKRVIGIGNALVDILARIKDDGLLDELSLPKGSMQLVGEERFEAVCRIMETLDAEKSTGGSAANTVLAMAQLGDQPGFVGKIGDDAVGRFFSERFQSQGVQTHLAVVPQHSGVASTFISPDGQRTFATYLGAAAGLAAEELKPETFRGYDYLYVEGYLVQNHALIDRAFELARRAGLQMCLDMASYNIVEADYDFFVHLVDQTDIVFANADEARAFTGKKPHEAAEVLAGRNRIAVVKNGSKGAVVRHHGTTFDVPAHEVSHVVDTTAAGDFFAAGFLYAMCRGASLTLCADLGSLLAAQVIQVVGTELPAPVWDTIKSHPAFSA